MLSHAATIEFEFGNPRWNPSMDLEETGITPMGMAEDHELTFDDEDVLDWDRLVKASQQRTCMILVEDDDEKMWNTSGIIL